MRQNQNSVKSTRFVYVIWLECITDLTELQIE